MFSCIKTKQKLSSFPIVARTGASIAVAWAVGVVGVISAVGQWNNHHHKDNDRDNDGEDGKGQSHPGQNTTSFGVLTKNAKTYSTQDESYQTCNIQSEIYVKSCKVVYLNYEFKP